MAQGPKESLNLQEMLKDELNKARMIYPHEQENNWLSILLDIYHLVDSWVKVDIMQKGIENTIQCRKGCGHCCKTLTIPINHLEYKGLCWYISEVLGKEEKDRIKSRFLTWKEDSECPFLIEEACSVYPLRPIACRQYFVLNYPCYQTENPWLKRIEDIYCALNDDISWQIAQRYFHFYGIRDLQVQRKVYEQGGFAQDDRPMTTYDWAGLVAKLNNIRT